MVVLVRIPTDVTAGGSQFYPFPDIHWPIRTIIPRGRSWESFCHHRRQNWSHCCQIRLKWALLLRKVASSWHFLRWCILFYVNFTKYTVKHPSCGIGKKRLNQCWLLYQSQSRMISTIMGLQNAYAVGKKRIIESSLRAMDAFEACMSRKHSDGMK